MKSSIFKNIFYLFFSTAFTRALNAFSIIILADYFGAEKYGMFSVAVAFAMVAGYFTDVGLSNTVLREGSRQEKGLEVIIATYIKIRLALLVLTLLVSGLIIYYFYTNDALKTVMYIVVFLTVIGLSMQSISVVYFQLKEQMKQVAKVRTVSSILAIIFIFIGIFCELDVHIIISLYGFSYIIAGIYGLRMLFKDIDIKLNGPFQKSLLKGASSFIISGLLIMLLPQLGPLVLEKTISLAELGMFSVAYRIPAALYQIPGVVAGAFYPVLFKYYNSGRFIEHTKLNVLQVKVMAIMGIIVSVPLFHMAEFTISVLFGDKWIGAAIALKILSIMLFLQSINFPLADGLTTSNMQARRTIVQVIAIILGIFMYSGLSIYAGVKGAAIAAIFIEVLLLIGFIAFNPKRIIMLKKVAFPYTLVYLFCLIVVNQFIANNILATFINLFSVLSILVAFDREIRNGIQHYQDKIFSKFNRS
ncbi:oligosaccharide flippase family protein [Bacillus pacificus]|uniref:oligosaccharide flippase family protein n=1 Tax=Bacillus pacificus TaxID=2026187 RepID=UPI0015D4A9C3